MSTEDARAAVTAAGKRHWDAAMAADGDAIEELFCDDVAYYHSIGSLDTKSEYQERVASGLYRDAKIGFSPDQVFVIGDTAVVTATVVVSGKIGGAMLDEERKHVAVDTWCRRDGRWQLLAHAITPVREAADLYPGLTSH
jgi:uncharacterized protein (TIGR02246 family)